MPMAPKIFPVPPVGGQEPEPDALGAEQALDTSMPQTPEASAEQALSAPSVHIYDISGKEPVLGKIAPEEVTEAIASGKYSLPQGSRIPVISPDDEHGTIDPSEAIEAFQNGYRYATPHDLKMKEYSTPNQKLATALEGAASAATFGLSTGLERAAGVDEEGINARREANPYTHMAGQAAGLIGSMAIPGVGAANLLGDAGKLGAAAIGLAAPASTVGKIGSAIVKGAIENAIFQGGDEVSKMLASDPSQSVDTALTSVGLSGLVGGAFGVGAKGAGALWDATLGGKTSGLLNSIARKVGGIEGVEANSVESVIDKTGMELSPEIRARLSEDPEIKELSHTLEQSDTTSAGKKHQAQIKDFRKEAGDTIVRALGKDPESLAGMELSKYEAGKNIGNTLADEYHAQVSPLAKEFDVLKDKYASIELPKVSQTGSGTIAELSEKIGQLAQQEGWTASPSSEIMSEVNRVLKELPHQKNVRDLGNYIKAVGNNMQSDPLNGPLRRAGGMIKDLLKKAEADVIGSELGAKEGAEAVERYATVRKAYADQARLQEALESRLHAKGSTSGYAKSLRDMAQTDGEAIVRRLSGTNDAELLSFLQQNYPKTADAIRQFHVDSILKTAVDKAAVGHTINAPALSKALNKLSPELRNFVVNPEVGNKITAVSELLERFNNPHHNFSNTARTMDALMKNIPESAVAIATMITGHSPITAAIAGRLSSYLGKEVPDAARLALLKFLGTDRQISAPGFKAMVDFIHSTMKGEHLINKGAKAIFQTGKEVLPQSVLPKEKNRKDLQKAIESYNSDPKKALEVAGNTDHYLPDHAVAMGDTVGKAVQFLSTIKPVNPKATPLDKQMPPSREQEAAYNRALDIAQQPLIVLEKIKNGTLLPQDIAAVKTIYPALYSKLSQKITDEMIDAVDKGTPIPYKTKMAISMFLGQPMDSTLTPTGIQAAQPMQSQPAPGGESQQATKPEGRSMKSLDKIAGQYKTATQRREDQPLGSKKQ